jgi:hypothetical protein
LHLLPISTPYAKMLGKNHFVDIIGHVLIFFIQFSFVGPHIEHTGGGVVFNNELLDY